MEKPTREHTAGLEMAKEVVDAEGMCQKDVPGVLDHLIDQSNISPSGRPAIEELLDLVAELRSSGASTSPKRHTPGFQKGMSFALEIVLKRIKQLQ